MECNWSKEQRALAGPPVGKKYCKVKPQLRNLIVEPELRNRLIPQKVIRSRSELFGNPLNHDFEKINFVDHEFQTALRQDFKT